MARRGLMTPKSAASITAALTRRRNFFIRWKDDDFGMLKFLHQARQLVFHEELPGGEDVVAAMAVGGVVFQEVFAAAGERAAGA